VRAVYKNKGVLLLMRLLQFLHHILAIGLKDENEERDKKSYCVLDKVFEDGNAVKLLLEEISSFDEQYRKETENENNRGANNGRNRNINHTFY
jgi:hypothetical protein